MNERFDQLQRSRSRSHSRSASQENSGFKSDRLEIPKINPMGRKSLQKFLSNAKKILKGSPKSQPVDKPILSRQNQVKPLMQLDIRITDALYRSVEVFPYDTPITVCDRLLKQYLNGKPLFTYLSDKKQRKALHELIE